MTEMVALITGGGTGIGRATTAALRRAGYRVAIAGRRLEPLRLVSEETGATPYQCDLQRTDEIASLVEDVLRDHGRLDALVNNAGVAVRKLFEEVEQPEIDTLLTTNLVGPMLLMQRCLAALRETEGAIVNVSSSLAVQPQPRQAVYAAAKGGIEAFSRVLALELAADRVRVNVVQPGITRTEMVTVGHPDVESARAFLDVRRREFPLGRIGEPDDIASAIEFLLSPAASWITGTVLAVDGGRLLGTAPTS